MGTFAVAVYIMSVIESRRPLWKIKAAAVFLLGGAMVEFWWPGVALCVGACLYCKHPTAGALLLWLAGTAGLTLINGNWWACASFVVLAGMASLVTIEIPRAARLFYLYYPAHLDVFPLVGAQHSEPRMKRYAITRDVETAHVAVEVTDHGTSYRLQYIPFHSPTGFALDACEPGSMDVAIAIMGDWLGKHPTEDTLKTQFWECLWWAGECNAQFLARKTGTPV